MPSARRLINKSKKHAAMDSDPSEKPLVRVTEARRLSILALALCGFIFIVVVQVRGHFSMGRYVPPPVTSSSRVQGQGNRGLFKLETISGKGKGLVANRDIKEGELILREQPLFVVPSKTTLPPVQVVAKALAATTLKSREAFFNLSYVNFPPNLKPEENLDEVAFAIFQTNSVALDDNAGIFSRFARLNHGCAGAFNAVYSWRKTEQILVVHALKNIKKGEELLTSYTDPKKPRAQRREYLKSNYGFHCTCSVCSLDGDASRESDARLSMITELEARLSSWPEQKINSLEAIGLVRKIWELQDKEGYRSQRGRLAEDAAIIAAVHTDAAAARNWASLAVKWYGIELGADSAEVQKMQHIVRRPYIHPSWGSRKAHLDVGGL